METLPSANVFGALTPSCSHIYTELQVCEVSVLEAGHWDGAMEGVYEEALFSSYGDS